MLLAKLTRRVCKNCMCPLLPAALGVKSPRACLDGDGNEQQAWASFTSLLTACHLPCADKVGVLGMTWC